MDSHCSTQSSPLPEKVNNNQGINADKHCDLREAILFEDHPTTVNFDAHLECYAQVCGEIKNAELYEVNRSCYILPADERCSSYTFTTVARYTPIIGEYARFTDFTNMKGYGQRTKVISMSPPTGPWCAENTLIKVTYTLFTYTKGVYVMNITARYQDPFRLPELVNLRPAPHRVIHLKWLKNPFNREALKTMVPQMGFTDLLGLGSVVPEVADDIKVFLEKACDILPNLENSNEKFAELIDKMSEFVDKTNSANLQEELKNFLDKTSEGTKIESLTDSLYSAASVVAFLAASVNLAYRRDTTAWSAMAISTMCLFIFARDRVTKAFGFFSQFCSKHINFEPQGAFDLMGKALMMTIIACTTRFTNNDGFCMWQAYQAASKFANFEKFSRGISSVFEFIFDVISFICDKMNISKFLPDHLRYFHSNDSEITQVLKEVDAIFDSKNLQKFRYNKQNHLHIRRTLKKLNEVRTKIVRTPKTTGLYDSITDKVRELSALNKKFNETCYDLDGSRQEPQGLFFFGGAGCGKTISVDPLMKSLASIVMPPERLARYKQNPSTEQYNICAENEYMDRYDGQYFGYFDDIFQFVELPGNADSERCKLIRMLSSQLYAVHSSGIEDKGNVMFSSDIIIGTSNLPNFKSDVTVSQGALDRRIFDNAYFFVPKAEYCIPGTEANYMTRKMDWSKAACGEFSTHALPEFYEFPRIVRDLGADGGVRVVEILTYDEVIEATARKHHEKKMQYQQRKRNSENAFNRYGDDHRLRDMYGPDAVPNLKDNCDCATCFNLNRAACDIQLEQMHSQTGLKFSYVPMAGNASSSRALEPRESTPDLNDFNWESLDDIPIVDEINIQDNVGDAVKHVINLLLLNDGRNEKHKLLAENLKLVMCTYSHYGIYRSMSFEGILRKFLVNFGAVFIRDAAEMPNEVFIGRYGNYSEMCMTAWREDYVCVTNVLVVPLVDMFYDVMAFVRKASRTILGALGDFWDKIQPYRYILLTAVGMLFGATVLTTASVTYVTTTYYSGKGMLKAKDVFWEAFKERIAKCENPEAVASKMQEFILANWIDSTVMDEYADALFDMMTQSDFNSKKKVPYGRPKKLTPQAGDQATALLSSIYNRNVYHLTCQNQKLGLMWNLEGRIMLMPNHFQSVIAKGLEDGSILKTEKIVCTRTSADAANRQVIEMLVTDIFENFIDLDCFYEKDQFMFEAPRHFPSGRSMVEYIAKREDFDRKVSSDCVFVKPTPVGLDMTSIVGRFVEKSNVGGDGMEYTISEGIIGLGNTKKGDCGAMLALSRDRDNRRIIGMLTSGNDQALSLFTHVFQEEIKAGLAGITPRWGNTLEPQIHFQPSSGSVAGGRFNVIGELPNKIFLPKVSSLVKSSIFGLFGDYTKQPAMLKKTMVNGVLIDPYVNAYSKHGKASIPIPAEMKEVIKAQFDFYEMNCKFPYKREVISFKEAIAGAFDGMLKGIPRGTSPGYPYNTMGHTGKKKFFGSDGDYTFTSDDCIVLMREVEDVISKAKRGERSFFAFMDFLKDELRTKEKSENGMTRIISGSSVKYTSVFRMYFGAFMAFMSNNPVVGGTAIGMNQYSSSWHALVVTLRAMEANDENLVHSATDFAGFDTDNMPAMSWMILDEINHWYDDGDENATVRKVLWLELVNSRHIVEGKYVVEWALSLPSGHPLTTIINCIYNACLFRYCYFARHGFDHWYLRNFDDVFKLIVMGDDGKYACHPHEKDNMKQSVIGPIMESLGAHLQSALKGKLDDDWKAYDKDDFLKRTARFEPLVAKYVAPLDIEVVKAMPYYISKKLSRDEATLENVENAIREFSLHGEKIFNEYVPKLAKAVRETCGMSPKNTSWVSNINVVSNYGDFFFSSPGDFKPTDLKNMIKKTHESNPIVMLDSVIDQVVNSNVKLQPQSDFSHFESITTEGGGAAVLGGTTETAEDANAIVVQPAHIMKMPRSYYPANPGEAENSIKLTLSKPEVYSRGTFASTDVAGTFPNILMFDGMTTTMKSNKLQGVYGVKATSVFTLQVNGERFQQGRYILAGLYTGGSETGELTTTQWLQMHRFSKTQITQLPHVEVDINCDTSATLRLPYVAATPFYPWQLSGPSTIPGTPGFIFLYPYVPLAASGGSTTANWTLWVHYEDIELFGHTVPQSGFKPQSGRKKDLISAEQDGMKVSTGLKIVSDAAAGLAKIPALTFLFTPVSWLTNAASGIASAFGFSKPTQIDKANRVYREIAPYLSNSDTFDMSQPLGMHSTNKLQQLPFAGTSMDELSIDFMKSIKSHFTSFTWSTGTAGGTVLFNNVVSPAIFSIAQTDGTQAVVSQLPICFLANCFNKWRGGIEYTFKFVKTEFHSGRLAISFIPYTFDTAAPTITEATMAYTERTIIDVRECNEFVFTVPYVSNTNWKNTNGNFAPTGQLYVYIVDPLVAPANVSASITGIVEVRGAPDLSFAEPDITPYSYVAPFTQQSGFRPQAGSGTEADPCTLVNTTLGALKEESMTFDHMGACIGEAVLSLRDFLKRGGMVNYITSATSGFTIWPKQVTVALGTAALATGLTTTTRDPYSVFLPLFALSRGGIRIKGLVVDRTVNTVLQIGYNAGGDATQVNGISGTSLETQGQFIYDTSGTGILYTVSELGAWAVDVPYYECVPSLPSSYNLGTLGVNMANSSLTPRATLIGRQVGTSTTGWNLWRGVSDDFNMGCFVSIPPRAVFARP